jgi:hypothetical protein
MKSRLLGAFVALGLLASGAASAQHLPEPVGPVWLVYPRDTVPALKDMDDSKWLWAGFFMTVE